MSRVRSGRSALLAYIGFEVGRRIRGWPSPIGPILYAAGIGAVTWAAWSGRMGPVDAEDMIGELMLLALLFVYRFDAGADRESAFVEFLTPAFLPAREMIGGKIAATAVALLAFGVAAAAPAAVALRGDVAMALWLASLFVLLALAAAPAVLALEVLLRTRLPALALGSLVLIGLFVGVTMLERYEAFGRVTGIGAIRRGNFASLAPLAWRAAVATVVGAPLAAGLLAGPLTSVGRRPSRASASRSPRRGGARSAR